jgi:hypothetical protein
MGFYIRKSVSVGPLRFNLSKSGIGVSAGIRGFRIGTGPRGNYVHMGSGGLYYRQTLPSDSPKRREDSPPSLANAHESATHGPMEEISSGPVTKMVDSSSLLLLFELDGKRKRIVWWPYTAVVAIFFIIGMIAADFNYWIISPIGVLLAIGIAAIYVHDALAKSVVIMYDLDDSIRDAFENLHETVLGFARCGATWHVGARADVYDAKYHAGAGQLVDRKRISVRAHDPPYVKTNVTTVRIPIGNRVLYMFPDRMLVYGSEGIGAVSYDELEIDVGSKRFIEEDRVPFDAKVVDHTWRYVNRDGGPDRRFNNNRELPICLYEELYLSSSSGLNEVLQVSHQGLGDEFRASVSAMSKSIDGAREAELERQLTTQQERQQSQEITDEAHNTSKRLGAQASHDQDAPSIEVICDALLRVLCCVMVSDGRASQSERKSIGEIMQKVNAPWSHSDVDRRIDGFIATVLVTGYKQVLADTLSCVPLFTRIGREATLIQCVDAVAAAGKSLNDRDRALCDRIKQMVSR